MPASPMFFLWTDGSKFHSTGKCFLPGRCTLHEFCKNVPICNKICFSSEVTGFNSSEATSLSLDKAFSCRFSTCQRAKPINFKEMTGVFQALARWIETVKCSHLHIFGNNFVVVNGLQKNSINGEVMEPLRRIAILYAEHDIEVQALLSKTLWLICYYAVNIPRLLINILLYR